MKSRIRKSEYREIYQLLDKVSPLSRDCGELCGAICCGTGEYKYEDPDPESAGETPEMGIYLLPGEEKLHSKKDDWLDWSEERAEDYAFPDSWKGKVYFVRCKNPPHCPREKRPMQCRTFPLAPHFTEDGRLVMILNDLDLPYHCPLIEERIPLNADFMEATFRCWERLIKDPLIRDLIQMDSSERLENGCLFETVYDPALMACAVQPGRG